MLKCWKEVDGYNRMVKELWESLNFEGWGRYVLKEKLKALKKGLREWHKNHYQNFGERINEVKSEIKRLELKGKELDLSATIIESLRDCNTKLYQRSSLHNNILHQRAKQNWIKEGDTNSKLFHGYINHRRRNEALSLVLE